jgi:hypothetical protein
LHSFSLFGGVASWRILNNRVFLKTLQSGLEKLVTGSGADFPFIFSSKIFISQNVLEIGIVRGKLGSLLRALFGRFFANFRQKAFFPGKSVALNFVIVVFLVFGTTYWEKGDDVERLVVNFERICQFVNKTTFVGSIKCSLSKLVENTS